MHKLPQPASQINFQVDHKQARNQQRHKFSSAGMNPLVEMVKM